MHSQSIEHDSAEPTEAYLAISSFTDANYLAVEESGSNEISPTKFYTRFVGEMDLYASVSTVASYLDAHQDWFHRCAQPMKVEPIGSNGYALTIGCFGAFGYQVEPKVGLDLLPQDQGVYRIKTISVPGYAPQGYDVDFQAAMKLVEASVPNAIQRDLSKHSFVPTEMTQIEWQLDLFVTIQFPKFIHALPKSVIQNTGDNLLGKIVRQVSRRLTYKVQEDFHATLGLPFPKNLKRKKF